MYVSSMYVCLRERRFMYVWMSEVDARLWISIPFGTRSLKSLLMRRANSEYVCMSEAPEHVCMSLSNLQNLLVSEGVKFLT